MECGAGCGIVLLVNSSTIVVIRGPRATLWGSVYLDEHGEEDRDLKYVSDMSHILHIFGGRKGHENIFTVIIHHC